MGFLLDLGRQSVTLHLGVDLFHDHGSGAVSTQREHGSLVHRALGVRADDGYGGNIRAGMLILDSIPKPSVVVPLTANLMGTPAMVGKVAAVSRNMGEHRLRPSCPHLRSDPCSSEPGHLPAAQ